MSTHPVVGRTSGLPIGTGHCEMAAVTGVFSLWPGWSIPKKGTRRDWPTLLSYFSQTHQSNLSLSCRGMGRSHSIFLLVIFSYGNMKPRETKSPALTNISILPGLERNCLWHDLVRWPAAGGTPPTTGPGLCFTSKIHPQQRYRLSASDLQLQRDLLMLHTVLGPWALGPSW